MRMFHVNVNFRGFPTKRTPFVQWLRFNCTQVSVYGILKCKRFMHQQQTFHNKASMGNDSSRSTHHSQTMFKVAKFTAPFYSFFIFAIFPSIFSDKLCIATLLHHIWYFIRIFGIIVMWALVEQSPYTKKKKSTAFSLSWKCYRSR